jgi:hypothetical protein
MTSSYESYSRAGVDEPDVGMPHILKHILRISLPARAVNRGPAYLGRITGQTGIYGPPPCRKRKVRVTGWSAQIYSALLEQYLVARMECAVLFSFLIAMQATSYQCVPNLRLNGR